MLLLACGNGANSVFVDISAIVGIKNMIEKYPVIEIQRLLGSSNDCEVLLKKLLGSIRVEEPHNDITQFEGKIKLNGFPKALDVNIDNMLLKGSILHSNS